MRLAATMLLFGSIVLAACSGDGAETTTTTTTTTTATDSATPTEAPTGGEGRTAQDGDAVEVHYVGTLDDGSQFDSSRDREPLPFVVGSDQVIAGFDEAVRGLAVGDVVTVRIPPEDAYGERDDELVFSVPIEEAPDDVAAGDEVLIGGVTTGIVTQVTETEVVIDTNHRFAGEALTFEIELLSIE